MLLFDYVAKKKLLIFTASHQFLNTAGQHHAGQGYTDWELTGVDSTQRDAYGKARNVVTLNGRAPFLPPLELTEMRNLLLDADQCHREEKVETYPFKAFWNIMSISCTGRRAVLFGSKRRVNATDFPESKMRER